MDTLRTATAGAALPSVPICLKKSSARSLHTSQSSSPCFGLAFIKGNAAAAPLPVVADDVDADVVAAGDVDGEAAGALARESAVARPPKWETASMLPMAAVKMAAGRLNNACIFALVAKNDSASTRPS